jgi:cytochrome P450 family 130
MYSGLRDHDPVHHVIPPDKPDHDYYVMSRHADIWAAARDHETFSSAQGLTVNYGELELIGLQDNPPFVMRDPPVHTEFRKLVSRGFTPRQVEAVEPKVREFVVERIERLRADGAGDIVAELFKPLPSMVVAHYLGVPRRTAISSTAGPRRSSRPTPLAVAWPERSAFSATHSAR